MRSWLLGGADFRVVPAVALACNLVVVAEGNWEALRTGWVSPQLAIAFTAGGVPMAGFRIWMQQTIC